MVMAAILLALGMLIWLWRTWEALRREREENRRLREILQVGDQKAQSDLDQLRKLRHDLRHDLLLAEQSTLSGETAAALRDSLQAGGDLPWGNSWAVSALEEHYREQAAALGFQADLRILPPKGWETDMPDLCLMLSNLLENSIEALQREGGGWMRARSVSTGGYFSLVVGNTCTRTLRTFHGHYLSSKAPGRRGLGLETVQEAAQRWGGQADFKVENGEFRASVFLPRPEARRPEASAPAENIPVFSHHNRVT